MRACSAINSPETLLVSGEFYLISVGYRQEWSSRRSKENAAARREEDSRKRSIPQAYGSPSTVHHIRTSSLAEVNDLRGGSIWFRCKHFE